MSTFVAPIFQGPVMYKLYDWGVIWKDDILKNMF